MSSSAPTSNPLPTQCGHTQYLLQHLEDPANPNARWVSWWQPSSQGPKSVRVTANEMPIQVYSFEVPDSTGQSPSTFELVAGDTLLASAELNAGHLSVPVTRCANAERGLETETRGTPIGCMRVNRGRRSRGEPVSVTFQSMNPYGIPADKYNLSKTGWTTFAVVGEEPVQGISGGRVSYVSINPDAGCTTRCTPGFLTRGSGDIMEHTV
ncbi:uncharacterized protein MKK02DRAFT_40354 [Dioszegia hungarica]|uniref:Uncharacterized protein n=1 Tax=Dioszegia hungarica TaxID=4972 RepID=A0AA38H5S0_9TREE|nr:uncharacterized protein MKK02DRAFT_40354 [Dioszegia hungarica]KAI9632974.1 hypothetical protein MKK02DRAFT_40354 [Dioszegia hungarica]